MKLAAIITCFSLFYLTGCQSTQATFTQQLIPHTFQLISIGQDKLSDSAIVLRFGEGMRVNGFAGCNQFFGQGMVSDGRFRIEQLGMTRKLCTAEINQLEQQLFAMLTADSVMTLKQDILTLNADSQIQFMKVNTHTSLSNP